LANAKGNMHITHQFSFALIALTFSLTALLNAAESVDNPSAKCTSITNHVLITAISKPTVG
jgi:hypothetical protein